MDAQRCEETTTKVIWKLPSPTPYSELVKAATVAHHELEKQGRGIYDDSLMVEAHDDEVYLFYVKEGP